MPVTISVDSAGSWGFVAGCFRWVEPAGDDLLIMVPSQWEAFSWVLGIST